MKGDKIKKGQVMVEGYATQKGELSFRSKLESGIYALERV